MGVITFGGIASNTLKIVVEEPPEYHFPARDYEAVHIPGRNGDLVLDSGSYQNVPREYKIAIADKQGQANEVNPLTDFMDIVPAVSAWLHSGSGYQRLVDTYDDGVYRLAYYKDDGSVENILGKAGRCTISFDCKPQRFLTSGDTSTQVTFSGSSATASMVNPTIQTALPKISIVGSGTIRITITNTYAVSNICDMTISNIDTGIIIDSETQNVYMNSVSMNPNVEFITDMGFPTLPKGTSTITFTVESGTFTSAEVIPRWWSL